jgi:hypothetical protein
MTTQYSPEQLNDLRQKVLAGQDVSVEEYAAIITSLRQKRTGDVAAAHEAKVKKTPTSKTPVELPEIFNDL